MRVRGFVFVLFGLFCAPALCSAGPIEFQLTPTNLQVQPGTPAISAALYSLEPSSTCNTFDPITGAPTVVPLVGYDPTRLAQPAPIDIHPDGTTHWNNDGYFRVDYCFTDVASGESAEFSAWGRAHMYNVYGNGQWSGTTYFWFGGVQKVTLGGNDYTIWGPGSQGQYTSELPALSVWVGPNVPATLSPEPGTFALFALGLAPLAGLRRLRRI